MSSFQQELKLKMQYLAKEVYRVSKSFPNKERYGITSQLRRSAMSVVLNYIEGYARFRKKEKLHFFEISYGSLKETVYLVYFVYTEDYIEKENYQELVDMTDEIGKMLWRMMVPLR